MHVPFVQQKDKKQFPLLRLNTQNVLFFPPSCRLSDTLLQTVAHER